MVCLLRHSGHVYSNLTASSFSFRANVLRLARPRTVPGGLHYALVDAGGPLRDLHDVDMRHLSGRLSTPRELRLRDGRKVHTPPDRALPGDFVRTTNRIRLSQTRESSLWRRPVASPRLSLVRLASQYAVSTART